MHMQLERMRAMHYKYSDLFYKLIVVSLLAMYDGCNAAETLRATVFIIPFFTIYVGVQSAYFLTYTTFARVYATGLEQRINKVLGGDVLVAHRIEAEYLFPLAGPQFAGVPARLGQTFIGFLTIHFWMTGAAAIALSTYRAWQLLPDADERSRPPATTSGPSPRGLYCTLSICSGISARAATKSSDHEHRAGSLRHQLRRGVSVWSLRLSRLSSNTSD
ncbi:MAG: hypothetical protein WKF30_04225 [Pyrinomonadaceae bacterium]